MNLDEVVNRFGQLEGAEVGHGYLHSTSPNLDLKDITEDFIAHHPYLHQDPDYIAFLRRYAGTSLDREDMQWHVLVYGFHFDWMPFIFLDEAHEFPSRDGYFIFCETTIIRSDVKNALGAHYAFDSTGKLKPGVYQRVQWRHADELRYEWYCGSFVEWFDDLVKQEGILF